MALTQVKTSGIAADAIDGTKLADGAVANEHIAADAVNLTQMAHGTDGRLITYDTNGAPGFVATGNDGQVLTSQGAGNVPQFETPAPGVGGATGVDFNDDVKVRLGTGNDLKLYHENSSTTNWIEGPGKITIQSSDNNIELNPKSGETGVKVITDGAVELYHNNAKEFRTLANGVELTSDTHASGTTQTIYLSPTNQTDQSRSCSIAATNTDGNNNNDLLFKTCAAATPAERMRINSSGNVGIGSSPAGSFRLKLDGGDSAEGLFIHAGASSSQWLIRAEDNAANQRFVVKADGEVVIGDGNLVIGTAGHGIDFSAASNVGGMTSELFDDYEEGTFTPGTTNADFSTRTGWYTKVGRLVHVQLKVEGGSNFNGSNAIYITGLPYTNNATKDVVGSAMFYKINFASGYTDLVTPYIQGGGNNIYFMRQNSGSGSGNYLLAGACYTNASIDVNITYFAST